MIVISGTTVLPDAEPGHVWVQDMDDPAGTAIQVPLDSAHPQVYGAIAYVGGLRRHPIGTTEMEIASLFEDQEQAMKNAQAAGREARQEESN